MKNYFVSFHVQLAGGRNGFGSMSIASTLKPHQKGTINEWQRHISDNLPGPFKGEQVVILNYKRQAWWLP